MRNIIMSFVAAATILLAPAAAKAQSNASANTTASVTILRPISVTADQALIFGSVVRPTSGTGSVTVNTASSRSTSGGVAVLATPAPMTAQFTIAGEGGQAISVTIPETVMMTRSGGIETLVVTTTSDLTAGAQVLSGSLGSAGILVVKVGGSLPVADNTASGAYSGTMTVTANYN